MTYPAVMSQRGTIAVRSAMVEVTIMNTAAARAASTNRNENASERNVSSVVALNGGTTTTEVARALAVRPELTGGVDDAQLTVVTNALNIANELLVRSRMKIVVAGGVVRPQSFELVGPLGSALLREVTLDVALLGADAIDVGLGAAAHNEGEAGINAQMVARAKRVVIIADSSKLGGHAFARICPIERVDTLVTDSGATPERIAEFEAAGVHVICA